MNASARLSALALLALAPLAHADGMPEVELPLVPASVDPRGRRAAAIDGPSELAGGHLTVSPGETKVLVVSAGNVNRIVTPFANPDVVTTSPDQFKVRQNVVYAAPAAGEPVTLYLTEQGDETTSISLVLVPRVNVASREFRLALAEGAARPRPPASVERAGDWERDQPYETTLTDLMARLAAGGVPQGYDLATRIDPGTAPRCAAAGPFRIDFGHGQHLTGGRLEAWVGTVTNLSARAAEFSETLCAASGPTAAVALWPSPRLPAGARAEIYVVRRLPAPEEQALPRPSLLEAGHAGG